MQLAPEFLPVSRHTLRDGTVLSLIGDRSTVKRGDDTIRLTSDETKSLFEQLVAANLRSAARYELNGSNRPLVIDPDDAERVLWDHFARKRFCGDPYVDPYEFRLPVMPDLDELNWPRKKLVEGTMLGMYAGIEDDGEPYLWWQAGAFTGRMELMLPPDELAALRNDIAKALAGRATPRLAPLRATSEVFTFETEGSRCRIRRHDLERLDAWLADPQE